MKTIGIVLGFLGRLFLILLKFGIGMVLAILLVITGFHLVAWGTVPELWSSLKLALWVGLALVAITAIVAFVAVIRVRLKKPS